MLLFAAACGGRSASTSETPNPPPAPPLPPGHIACGSTSCPPEQYCIESTVYGGMAPEPGEPANVSTSYGCSATVPEMGTAGQCDAPEGRRVHCTAAAP